MKIESLIKRPGGTIVDMDAPVRQYHFKPENNDQPHEAPHVAIVDEESHARMLLRIREGFRLVDGEELPEGQAEGFLRKDQMLIGSNIHNASYEIAGGETVQLGELVVMAFTDSGLTYEQWQDLADQERYEYIDATLEELQAGEAELDNENPPPAPAPVAEPQKPAEPAPAPAAPVSEQPKEDQPKAPEASTGEQQPAPQDNTQQANGPTADPDTAPKAEEVVRHVDEIPLAERPRKELVAMFKARFGREPSTRMNIPDIAAALSEED